MAKEMEFLLSESSSDPRKQEHYLPFLDGLRGVAVSWILLFHLGLPGWETGYLGVDIFYVISGFLITRNNLSNSLDGSFTLRDFYFRRMRRLLPELYVVLFVTLVVSLFLATNQGLLEVAQSGLAQSFMVANYYFLSKVSYFDTAASAKPLLHCWSLSVEEQFYAVYSTFLNFGRRLPTPIRVGVLGVSGVISFSAFWWFEQHNPSLCFYSLPTRIWELLVGCLVAELLVRKRVNSKNYICISYIVSLSVFLLVCGTVANTQSIQARFSHPTAMITGVVVVGTGIIIGVNAHFRASNPADAGGVWCAPLQWVGRWSYSLYLWHWPMICFFRCFYSFTKPIFPTVLLVFLIFFFSGLSDYFVAATYRRKKLNEWRKVYFLVPALFITCCIVFIQVPIGSRVTWLGFKPIELTLKAVAGDRSDHFYWWSGCSAKVIPGCASAVICKKGACGIHDNTSSSSSPPRLIVMLGDSHMNVLLSPQFPNLDRVSNNAKLNNATHSKFQGILEEVEHRRNPMLLNIHNTYIAFFLGAGCPPFVDIDLIKGPPTASCTLVGKEINKFVTQWKEHIDLIVVAAKWELYIEAGRIPWDQDTINRHGLGSLTMAERPVEIFRIMMNRTLEFLSPIPVGVIADVPTFPAYSGSRDLCWNNLNCDGHKHLQPLAVSLKRKSYQILLELGEEEGVSVYNPTDILCRDGVCSPYNQEGDMVYTDTDHLNYYGVSMLYPSLNTFIRTLLDKGRKHAALPKQQYPHTLMAHFLQTN